MALRHQQICYSRLPVSHTVRRRHGLGPNHLRPERLSAWLREQVVPIVARVADGALLIDPRTLLPGEDEWVVDALRRWGDRSGTTEYQGL